MTWQKVISKLGPGDDTVRLDAKGLEPDNGQPFTEVPRRIDAELSGGGGKDTIRGHDGSTKSRAVGAPT